jgi:hypothetical protein
MTPFVPGAGPPPTRMPILLIAIKKFRPQGLRGSINAAMRDALAALLL